MLAPADAPGTARVKRGAWPFGLRFGSIASRCACAVQTCNSSASPPCSRTARRCGCFCYCCAAWPPQLQSQLYPVLLLL